VLGSVDVVERTAEGVSTEVCRVRRGAETFYLRLGYETTDMAPEVEAHERLRALGVRVADIVHYEPLAHEVGCSVAITSEVAGVALIGCEDEQLSRAVAREAGRDLALLNSIEVEGWGWVARDGRPRIRGPYPSRAAWIGDAIMAEARDPLATILGSDAMAVLERLLEEESARAPGGSRLAHGDFDVSQIFHDGTAYTGIIDLGDMLGAESHYDLAHFLVHDTEQNRYALLSDVLAGYAELTDTDTDADRLVRTGIVLAVFRHTRVLGRWGIAANDHPYVRWMSGRIADLLARI
jgi:aminoglycoside phosphotransferase (APT) family kinase protein